MGSGSSRSSAPVTLYVFGLSPPCRAVLLTAKLINAPYQQKTIDILKGEQNAEEFLKMNPDHCVPTLKSDNFCLWESRAIMKYLVDTYAPGHHLYPKSPEQRAIVDRYLFYDAATASERIIADFMRPQLLKNEPADPERQHEVEKVLHYLEKALATNKTKFFAGEHATIADISLMATISFLELNHWDFTKWPKIVEWRAEVEKLQHYEEVNKPLKDFAAKRREQLQS